MRKEKIRLVLGGALVILAVLGMLSTSAWAVPRLKWSVDTSFSYDTNVELREEDEEEALVATISPSISLQFPGSKAYGEIGYGFGYSSVFDGISWDVVTHDAFGLLRYDFSPLTSIGVSDTFKVYEIPETDRETLDVNTASVSLHKQIGSKLTLEGRYDYQIFDDNSDVDNFSDYDDHGLTASLGYIITPKLSIGVEGNYHQRDFDDVATKDYDAYSGALSLTKTIGSKSDISGEIGYETRDYDHSEDTDSITGGAELNIRLTGKTSIAITYDYGLQDTYIVTTDRIGEIAQPAIIALTTLDNLDRFYSVMKVHRVTPSVAINFTERDTVDLFTAYQVSNSDEKYYLGTATASDLDEDLVELGIGYSHRFTKYFLVGLNYTYGQRDSNVRGDYDYNRYTLGVHLGF